MQRIKIGKQQWIIGTLALGLSVATMPGVLLANPEQNDGPPPPPQGQNGGPRDGRGGGPNDRRGDNRKMSPEQRDQEMRQRRTQQLNQMLSDAGFIDKEVQDAVIAFANAQDDEHKNARDNARNLSEALQEGEDNVTLAAILADMRADVKESEARRAAALNALDMQIHYKSNARLEAVLVLSGLTGEAMPGGGRGGDGPGRGGNRGDGPGRGDGGGNRGNRGGGER